MKNVSEFLKKVLENKDFSKRLDISECPDSDCLDAINNVLKYLEEKSYRVEKIKKERNNLKKKLQDEIYQTQQFVHILCHDLKNPLGACESYKELLDEDPEMLEVYLPKIFANVNRSLEMLDEIKNLMSVTQGKISLKLDYHPIKPLIEESVLVLENRLNEKNITIENKTEGSHDVLLDKGTFVTSVVNNILTNAIKFSEEGEKISISYTKKENLYELIFRDYGVGIPQSMVDKLFDPLEQTTRNGTKGERGTGFGMPLIKRFVESYEGNIEVNSWDINDFPDEHGTEIIIRLWVK